MGVDAGLQAHILEAEIGVPGSEGIDPDEPALKGVAHRRGAAAGSPEVVEQDCQIEFQARDRSDGCIHTQQGVVGLVPLSLKDG